MEQPTTSTKGLKPRKDGLMASTFRFILTNNSEFIGTWDEFTAAYPVKTLVANDISLRCTVALDPIEPLVILA